MKNVINFLPMILGTYEFLSHAIPSQKNHSILKAVFKGLSFLSDLLNRQKPYTNSGLKIVVALALCFAFASCKTLRETAKNTECISQKYVDVTFVAKDGYRATIRVPYCDTIGVGTRADVPDTLILKENK